MFVGRRNELKLLNEYVVFFTKWDHAERGRAYFLQSVQRAPDLPQDNQSFVQAGRSCHHGMRNQTSEY